MVKTGFMKSGDPELSTTVKMRGRSIGHHISFLVALAVLLSVSLVTAVFTYSSLTREFAAREQALEATGYVFASALADHVAAKDSAEALRVLRSISRIPSIRYAAVVDEKGRAFASFGSAVIMDPESLRAGLGMFDAIRSGIYPVAADIRKSGNRIGQVILIADVSDMLWQLLQNLLLSLAVAVIAVISGIVLSRRLQSRITGPIRSLTAAMQEIRGSRRYKSHVVSTADGEPGLLIDSFNAMIDEIRRRDEALDKHRQTLEATVEQRTQELRLARDAAEHANEAKSSFLATMSHEIRTPLNGLMVMAELLAGAGLDQRLQRYAEVIVKSGQSLLTIINDILDLSKIEAGKLQLEQIPVNPASIADDVTSLFWEKASSKNLDLAARVAPNMPLALAADPVRLNQILSNLVNNALKFTDQGQVLISLSFEQGHLVMAVSDSGIGIPQKKLNQLFEAFSQADQTITRKFGGSGLGLAICKRLAEAMGGTISVRSELGKGSTFMVRLPLPVCEAPRPHRIRPLRIGLAVDGLATQSALGTGLAGAGHHVHLIGGTAEEADVVFASANRLAALGLGGKSRPIVICLGWIGESEAEAAIASGRADDLMILPLRQQDIAEMIVRLDAGALRGKAVLERRRTASQGMGTSFHGRHVIVADDNAVNREVIIEVLRQLDVTCDVAVNGREAVDLWTARRPDLIFMDCSMPELDGFSATREIRAHEALAIAGGHTPIVALTAHVAGTDSNAWREAGMDAYMTKPFTLNQIVACLETHFAGKPMAAVEEAKDHAAEARAAEAGTVLDPAVLDELRSIGGSTALFTRVLDLFAGRVPQAVEQMTALSSGEDAKALADAVHALKSMCANVGASRAVEACNSLETAARSPQPFDAGALVGDVVREIRLVMVEVDRLRRAG